MGATTTTPTTNITRITTTVTTWLSRSQLNWHRRNEKSRQKQKFYNDIASPCYSIFQNNTTTKTYKNKWTHVFDSNWNGLMEVNQRKNKLWKIDTITNWNSMQFFIGTIHSCIILNCTIKRLFLSLAYYLVFCNLIYKNTKFTTTLCITIEYTNTPSCLRL